jgi:hypothetical protein
MKKYKSQLNEDRPQIGIKSYVINPTIGKVKYSVSYYDGISTHNDGSPFYGIATFKNKSDLFKYISRLTHEGYREE